MPEPVEPALLDLLVEAARGEMIRVLEPPETNREALCEAIPAGSYARPFIGQCRLGRSLYFSLDTVQSRMHFDDPFALALRYTRKAMSFLLFQARTRDVLLLGLGGGSIAKFCHRYLPEARIHAVERNPDVIALGAYFFVPVGSERFVVIHDDAARYVGQSREGFDVVIADAFHHGGLAAPLRSVAFYESVRERLRDGGIFVANLAGDGDERHDTLSAIASVFPDDLLLVPVEGEGNEIVLAFKSGMAIPWRSIRTRAIALERRLGLDFPRYAGRLERSKKLGYVGRALREG